MPRTKNFLIPFEHLHGEVKEQIKEIQNERIVRLFGSTLGPFALLAARDLWLKMTGVGSIMVAGWSNKTISGKLAELGRHLRTEPEHKIIATRHLTTYDWPELKKKYPLAFVNMHGDLVLTTRERLLKIVGRMRVPLK